MKWLMKLFNVLSSSHARVDNFSDGDQKNEDEITLNMLNVEKNIDLVATERQTHTWNYRQTWW
jgi:hypothetical protein